MALVGEGGTDDSRGKRLIATEVSSYAFYVVIIQFCLLSVISNTLPALQVMGACITWSAWHPPDLESMKVVMTIAKSV